MKRWKKPMLRMRRRALAAVLPGARTPPSPEADKRTVLQQLKIHELELEAQNEELRGARRELEATLERYSEVFDFAPIGYACIREDLRLIDINHAGCQLLGRQRSRLRTQHFDTLIVPEHRDALRQLLVRAEISGTRQSCEVDLATLERGRVPARLSATILRRSGVQILLAFEDISDRKAKETELLRAERALRAANESKDDFLAALSHEIRSPLVPIRNSAFILTRTTPGSQEALRSQAILDRQVDHLTRLVEDLLDVTRITRRKLELQLESLDVGVLLRRILEDKRAGFEAGEVRLDGELAPAPLWVRGDPTRLTQVVNNLLSNALKFSGRGSTVTLEVRRRSEWIELQVVDRGIGISPEFLEHAFEPFTQSPHGRGRHGAGLGLGLSLVKGLVELHGGSISITSPGIGHGTVVTVRLPANEPTAAAAPAAIAAERRTLRILVIDDDVDGAETLQIVLQLSGHEVKVAHDGPAGLALARELCPEVVISDIDLPGMNGHAVARAFRADGALSGAFLIALSGHGQAAELERARAAGFDRYFTKPASLDMLQQVLAETPDR